MLVLSWSPRAGTLTPTMMDPADLRKLIEELLRSHTEGSPDHPPQSARFKDGLKVVLEQLSQFHDSRDWETLPLADRELLWQVPTFDGGMLMHYLSNTKAFYKRLLPIRLDPSSGSEYIWSSKHVGSWCSSNDAPPVLLMKGGPSTKKSMERFSYEFAEEQEKGHPTIHILNAPVLSASSAPTRKIRALDLLRSLALQAAAHAVSGEGDPSCRPWRDWPARPTLGLFASIVRGFRDARDRQSLFAILYGFLRQLRSPRIILDLSILGGDYGEATLWAGQFHHLACQLSAEDSTTGLKILLLDCRKLVEPALGTVALDLGVNSVRLVHAAEAVSSAGASSPTRDAADLSYSYPFWKSDPSDEPTSPEDDTTGARRLEKHRDDSQAAVAGVTMYSAPRTDQVRPCTTSEAVKLGGPRPSSRDAFSIAIFCALPLEANPVISSFTQIWEWQDYGKDRHDQNTYTLGAIQQHNIVVVHLPGPGKSNAALAGDNLGRSFTNIGLALVVGICGGVPVISGSEVLLGDVLISTGLVPYDHGSQYPDQFIRKESAWRPNIRTQGLLAKLTGQRDRQKLQSVGNSYLDNLLSQLARRDEHVVYPGSGQDQLFRAEYRHKHQVSSACVVCAQAETGSDRVCDTSLTATCEELGCAPDHLTRRKRAQRFVDRTRTEATEARLSPMVHFGLYASGDKIMKSGEERDRIAKKESIVAYEMEGAGVWKVYTDRTLIIKAACDYADSHKNKRWQDYAAVSAAAFTRRFIEIFKEEWPN